MKKGIILPILLLVLTAPVSSQNLDPLWDIWKYEHGITMEEFTTAAGDVNYYITWSSSAGDAWGHDIFNRIVSIDAGGRVQTVQSDKRYIATWEAQEPVSTSINPANNIIFTVFEDGSDSRIPDEAVNVHGQLHLPDGTIIKENFLIAGGADAQHSAVSGHVRGKFLAVYVDDDMGNSGVSAVKVRVYDDQSGDSLQTVNLTPLTEYHWWPVIAGTDNHSRALCVWIVNTQYLNARLIYERNGEIALTPNKRILSGVQFVNQQVNWLQNISKFVVIAKKLNSDESKLCLIDTLGDKLLEQTLAGAVFQEAKPAVKWDALAQSYIYVYPTGKNDLNILKISEGDIAFQQKITGNSNPTLKYYQWKETGIWSAFIRSADGADKWDDHFIALFAMGNYATNGVHLIPVHIAANILMGVKDAGQAERFGRRMSLRQNYPNPFGNTASSRQVEPAMTTIDYSLAEPGVAGIKIYDIRGRLIATLAEGFHPAGDYQVRWSAVGQASGLYFCQLQSGEFSRVIKMIVR